MHKSILERCSLFGFHFYLHYCYKISIMHNGMFSWKNNSNNSEMLGLGFGVFFCCCLFIFWLAVFLLVVVLWFGFLLLVQTHTFRYIGTTVRKLFPYPWSISIEVIEQCMPLLPELVIGFHLAELTFPLIKNNNNNWILNCKYALDKGQ